MVFEIFQVSPLSESVLATKNALVFDFPGSAVSMPIQNFEEASFKIDLASFLDQASTEGVKRCAARTNKAGSFALESRDTVDPSLIAQVLTSILAVNGQSIFPSVLKKRVQRM